ncbi:MICOS complex subunit 26/27 [Brevipalpus obovatus]|uniref:MICOS complex subunit 26/27 n=1 Tax=Brevipalpus obovatus TaxID=246614 RepID=UPI003D9E7A69
MSTEKKPCCKNSESSPVTVDQLPIYGNPHPPKDVVKTDERGMIENTVFQARTTVQDNLKFMDGFYTRSKQIFETAKAHSMSTIDYIGDEENLLPKIGVITGGGLLGLLLSARRGIFKKMLYTSAGIGIMSGVCYPKQSSEMLDVAGYIVKNKAPTLVKEYTNIDIGRFFEGKKSDSKSSDP